MTEKEMIEEITKDLNGFFDKTPMELSFKHNDGKEDVITDKKALSVLDDIVRQALIPCFAKCLTELGYRKIPEGAVVLTREEMENLYTEEEYNKAYEQAEATILCNIADGGTSCHWCIKKHEEKASKETAREIIQLLDGHQFEDDGWTWSVSKRDLKFIAKKYGVEIEGGNEND